MDREQIAEIGQSGSGEQEKSHINISDVIDVIRTTDPSAQVVFNSGNLQSRTNENQIQPSTNAYPIDSILQNTLNNDKSMSASNPLNDSGGPSIVITEQPASKGLRFRYECEGRSAGSIPGENSTPTNKTYPSIKIEGYVGRAVVVVSCVTKDDDHGRYRPHPHNLVGRSCKKGVCTVEINPSTMSETFSNLGIQCVKKKDIEDALNIRQDQRVDPYRTGFTHRQQPSTIDLNAVRLCFQAFLEQNKHGKTSFSRPLKPVVSNIIYDKKAMSDLVICKLSKPSSSVAGGEEIILLCEKVTKEDIAVRFFETHNGNLQWEGFADFQHSDVHKQVAISFRTPKYKSQEITEPVKCFIQLKKPSDASTSDPLPFEYLPLDSGRRAIYAMRKGLRQKNSLDQLGRFLSLDTAFDALLTNGRNDSDEPAEKRHVNNTNFIAIETNRNGSKSPVTVENVRDVDMVDSAMKTVEWLQNAEFTPIAPIADDEVGRTLTEDELMETPGTDSTNRTLVKQISSEDQKTCTVRSDISNPDEDRTLNELLEQVAELDEIYSGYQMKRVGDKLVRVDKNSFDDTFDDAATYTSLQRAFKNPITIADPRPPSSCDDDKYDAVETIINPMAPLIDVSPMRRDLSNLQATEEEKLPPLPPKRFRKLTAENTEFNAQLRECDSDSLTASPERPLSQIIIKRTPDQGLKPRSPVPSDAGSSVNSSPQKKQGFFSRLFRRKSKPEIHSNCATEVKNTPETSREPSIINFDVADRNRLSSRSFRSPLSPSRFEKRGKPVGRSVSSVSGKRPHLTADIIHIPLKGGSTDSLQVRSGSGNIGPSQRYASQVTLSNQLDRKTVSALQLADLPIQDGNMELIAIADAQSLKNLCEGAYGVHLDDDVDLTEAEHFALYTSAAPHATASEFDETSQFYAAVENGEILTNEEIAKRLASGGFE